MNTTPLPGTLDWYRQKGESDKDIADLVAMIDYLKGQLVKALEAFVLELEKTNKTTP